MKNPLTIKSDLIFWCQCVQVATGKTAERMVDVLNLSKVFRCSFLVHNKLPPWVYPEHLVGWFGVCIQNSRTWRNGNEGNNIMIILKTINLLKSLFFGRISVKIQNVLATLHVSRNKKSAVLPLLNHPNVSVGMRTANNITTTPSINNPTSMEHLMERVLAEPHGNFLDLTKGGFVPPLTVPNDQCDWLVESGHPTTKKDEQTMK